MIPCRKLVFCLFSFFIVFPLVFSNSCGPSGSYQFEGYSFVNPNLLHKEIPYAPYLMNFRSLYESYERGIKDQAGGNLKEWRKSVCNLANIPDIQTIVYKTPVSDLKVLRSQFNGKPGALKGRWAANSFAQHLKASDCFDTVDYLIFAKECEPHVSRSADAWNPVQRDKVAMEKLIKKGRKLFRKTKNDFIKLRYTYQLIRLAHYSGAYKQAIELYDNMVPKVDDKNSIMHYWVLGHLAGALNQLGQEAKASYLYSIIFRNCPSKRESAFRSFNIQSETEWAETLALCSTQAEKATLYVMRASADESRVLPEMNHIYAIHPGDENLDLLLMKEIVKREEDLLGLEFNDKKKSNKRDHKIPRKDAGKQVIELLKFVQKANREGQLSNPQLWKIAEGYLEYLSGDLYAADKTFKEAEKIVTDDLYEEQLHVFQLALKINSYEELDGEDETDLVELKKEHRDLFKKYKDFPDFLNDRLAYVYHKQGDLGKGFLTHHEVAELKLNPEVEMLDNLIEICNKPEKSKLEQQFVTDEKNKPILNDLLDIKGTWLLTQDRPEAAMEQFKKIPRGERNNYQINPFVEHINDCVHCKVEPDTLVRYNKVELLEKIFEMEYNARADTERGPAYYYQLGLAYYNMSYFGYAWNATDFFRSGSYRFGRGMEANVSNHPPYGNLENVSNEKALFYFQKCIDLSHLPELKARATFMASKCMQNHYYISKDFKSPCCNKIPALPDAYLGFHKILKKEYSETDFYKDVIRECKYFKAYSRR